MITNFLKLDTRAFLLTALRWSFGLWLLYVGISKWLIIGPTGFVGYIESEFAATWLPGFAVTMTAWLILVLEPLIGAWLVSGRFQRIGWVAASLLMFMLMFGKTVSGEFATVADNWQYLVMCLVAAAWTRPEE